MDGATESAWDAAPSDPDALFLIDPETNEVRVNYVGSPAQMRQKITQTRLTIVRELKGVTPYETQTFLNDGLYTRRIWIPRGMVFMPRIPRMDGVQAVTAGDLSFVTEFGTCRSLAGSLSIATTGVPVLAFAHQDSQVVYVFRTDFTKPSDVEWELDAPELDPGEQTACH